MYCQLPSIHPGNFNIEKEVVNGAFGRMFPCTNRYNCDRTISMRYGWWRRPVCKCVLLFMVIPAPGECLWSLPSVQHQTSLPPGVLLLLPVCPWACGVASLPVYRLRTPCSWHETRRRLGHHCICLCSDRIDEFKLVSDRAQERYLSQAM